MYSISIQNPILYSHLTLHVVAQRTPAVPVCADQRYALQWLTQWCVRQK